MADPNQSYPADQYGHQDPDQPGFDQAGGPPPAQDVGGKKKKRGYAQQAYDFGGNAALGGQTQGGGQFPPAGTPVPAYGGYPQQAEAQPQYGQTPYGAQPGAPIPGAPAPYGSPQQFGAGVGGYQPPDAGYPGAAAPATAGGVTGITQGMDQMGMGGVPPPVAGQPQAAARPAVLNHLYPTDLLNQPFNVAELELPPPPIILPPNVSNFKNCCQSY
jgi:protein transport protein SEC24